MRLIPLAATATLFASAPAMAAVIFSHDFQDGDAQGWAAYGKGEVQLSRYESNVSMRLAGGAARRLPRSTRRASRICACPPPSRPKDFGVTMPAW